MARTTIFGNFLLDERSDSTFNAIAIEQEIRETEKHRMALTRVGELRDEMESLAAALDDEVGAALRDVTQLAVKMVVHRQGHSDTGRLALSLLLLARAVLKPAGSA